MPKIQNGRPLPRPLYQSAGPSSFVRNDAHAGLWYDKFGPPMATSLDDGSPLGWEGNSWSEAKANKLNWIRSVAGTVGCKELIGEFTERYKNLAVAAGGKVFSLQTDSRFVTGLGREHPIENGFAWHHTLGVPYLPGSSLKGLIRNWAEQWTDPPVDKNAVNNILGGPESVGRIIVLDVLPEMPPDLEADVMTPHYDEYYQNGKAPGDWISPIPIPFLVVSAGTRFQFSLLPRTSDDKVHLETVEAWIRDAVSWLGAGSKTAVGYGRFFDPLKEAPANLNSGQSQRKAVTVRIPTHLPDVNAEGIKSQLSQIELPHVLVKVIAKQGTDEYQVQHLKSAPKIPSGYQTEGSWTLVDAPAGLDAGVLVVATQQGTSKRAAYLEAVGRVPQVSSSKKPPPRR